MIQLKVKGTQSNFMSFSFSENQWGEKYIEEINRTDFVNTPSTDLFKRILDFNLKAENCLFIVSGSDSGLLLPWLREQKIGRGSRLAVIELDEVYALVAPAYRDVLDDNQCDSASVSPPPMTLHKLSTWQDDIFDGSDHAWIRTGDVQLLESNASTADYLRLYAPMLHAIGKSTEQQMAEVSTKLNRKFFSKMQLRNAADSMVPLKVNLAIGQGKTAVVLGGGPSLDLHLEWIKQHRDKIFLLAVSRIANKLMKEELKPDLVVSVDPQDMSYELSKQGVLWTDVPLAYNYHVSAKLLQQWQGPAFYMGKRLPWHSDKQLKNCVPASGPTASHSAVITASHLGFSQILMAGVDMCFSVSALAHADDSPEQMIQKMPTLCSAHVKTYSGKVAGSNISLKNGVDALEEIGAQFKKEGIRLFNLAEDAAYCPSIPYLAIDEITLPDKKPALSDYLDLEVLAITMQELEQLEKEFKLAKHAFSQIRAMCTKARTLVEEIYDVKAVGNTTKISSRLAQLHKQIESEYPDYISAVNYHCGVEFSKASVRTDFNDLSAEELVGWGQHYCKLIGRGARSLIQEINAQSPRLQLRRDEQDVNGDVRQLAKRWREDETPGRILRWKRLHGASVKPEDRAWVQRTIGKFRATLNSTAVEFSHSHRSQNESINSVLKSLVFLMQNQSISELQAIESKLDANLWPYSALKPYTAGLVQVLQNNPTCALNNFQEAIDTCTVRMDTHADTVDSMKRLNEECLVMMNSCYIKLNDCQSVLATLEMLSEMLPSYIVSYSSRLSLLGQRELAIELLQSYIEMYPANEKAQFLLTELAPEVVPTIIPEKNSVYREKISNTLQAIMGKSVRTGS